MLALLSIAAHRVISLCVYLFMPLRLSRILGGQPFPLLLRLAARLLDGLRDLALARLVVIIPFAGKVLAHLRLLNKLRHVARQFFLRRRQQRQTAQQASEWSFHHVPFDTEWSEQAHSPLKY